jgi:hypothetical protein
MCKAVKKSLLPQEARRHPPVLPTGVETLGPIKASLEWTKTKQKPCILKICLKLTLDCAYKVSMKHK